VGVQYEAMLGSSGSITPRIDFAYQSSFYTNVDNNPLSNVPGYTMLNGRITWNSPEHNWSLSLAVTNMANNFYYLNKVRLPIGITTGTLGAPREWSLSLRRKF